MRSLRGGRSTFKGLYIGYMERTDQEVPHSEAAEEDDLEIMVER